MLCHPDAEPATQSAVLGVIEQCSLQLARLEKGGKREKGHTLQLRKVQKEEKSKGHAFGIGSREPGRGLQPCGTPNRPLTDGRQAVLTLCSLRVDLT